MSYERMMKMKILKCSIIFIMLLAGYGYFENVANTTQYQNEVPKTEKIKQKNWKYYQEYSNIFEGASRKCGNSDTYYFENVEVIEDVYKRQFQDILLVVQVLVNLKM